MLTYYYQINNEITKEYESFLLKYTFNDVSFSEGVLKFDDIIHEMLLNQLKEYVLRDITTATCYYLALEKQKVDFDVLCFHAEHIIVKQSAFWEHLFQILNTYLELKMIPAKRLVSQENEKWKQTNVLNIRKLRWKMYRINSKLEQRIKPKRSFLNRANIIKKTKKVFVNDNYLRPLVNISNQQHWVYLRDMRNDIIHYKFLSQSSAVNLATEDITGILFTPKDQTVDHANLSLLLDKCLLDIYNAIDISYKIIRQDLVPKHKDSEQEDFILIKVLCKNEDNKPKLIPKMFIDIDNDLGDNPFRAVFCPECFSDDLIITNEEHRVSENTYEQLVGHYIGTKVQIYFEKRIKELDNTSESFE